MLGIQTLPLLGMIFGAVALWLVASFLILTFGDASLLNFIVDKVLFGLLAILMVFEIYTVAFHGGVPNIRMAPAIRKTIIAHLQNDQKTRGITNYTIVDLGSGNGLLTREIARAMPDATVIGVELARQSVAWANLMKRLMRLPNLQYRHMSLFDFDLSTVNAVVTFQLPGLLDRIGQKLHAEAQVGTVIASNKFPLGDGWVPEQSLTIKTLYLHQGALFLYRKTA